MRSLLNFLLFSFAVASVVIQTQALDGLQDDNGYIVTINGNVRIELDSPLNRIERAVDAIVALGENAVAGAAQNIRDFGRWIADYYRGGDANERNDLAQRVNSRVDIAEFFTGVGSSLPAVPRSRRTQQIDFINTSNKQKQTDSCVHLTELCSRMNKKYRHSKYVRGCVTCAKECMKKESGIDTYFKSSMKCPHTIMNNL